MVQKSRKGRQVSDITVFRQALASSGLILETKEENFCVYYLLTLLNTSLSVRCPTCKCRLPLIISEISFSPRFQSLIGKKAGVSISRLRKRGGAQRPPTSGLRFQQLELLAAGVSLLLPFLSFLFYASQQTWEYQVLAIPQVLLELLRPQQ